MAGEKITSSDWPIKTDVLQICAAPYYITEWFQCDDTEEGTTNCNIELSYVYC